MPDFPETMLTGRLVLNRIRADELPDYRAFYQDEKATATLGGVRSEERVRKWLDWQLQPWREHAFGWWTMRDRTTGAFVGRGGIQWAEVDGRNEVELGYGLLPGYWGLGQSPENPSSPPPMRKECTGWPLIPPGIPGLPHANRQAT